MTLFIFFPFLLLLRLVELGDTNSIAYIFIWPSWCRCFWSIKIVSFMFSIFSRFIRGSFFNNLGGEIRRALVSFINSSLKNRTFFKSSLSAFTALFYCPLNSYWIQLCSKQCPSLRCPHTFEIMFYISPPIFITPLSRVGSIPFHCLMYFS